MVNLKIELSIYSFGRRPLPASQWYRLSDDALHIHERGVGVVLHTVQSAVGAPLWDSRAPRLCPGPFLVLKHILCPPPLPGLRSTEPCGAPSVPRAARCPRRAITGGLVRLWPRSPGRVGPSHALCAARCPASAWAASCSVAAKGEV